VGDIAGLKGKSPETYPKPPTPPLPVFARNWATGPFGNQPTPSGIFEPIVWADVGFGAPGPGVDLTPRQTGQVRVIASVTFENTTGAPVFVTLQVQNSGAVFNAPQPSQLVPADGTATVPLVAELTLSLGEVATIEIWASASVASALEATAFDSTVDIQELPAATV
jgi:hypothetical protein